MLNQYDGKPLPDSMTEGVRFAFLQKDSARLMGTKRTFKRCGQSGMWFSDLLPHLATRADDLCMIQTMHTDQFNHHRAIDDAMWTGSLPFAQHGVLTRFGSENQDLPVMCGADIGTRPAELYVVESRFFAFHTWGVLFRNQGTPILNLDRPLWWSKEMDRHLLDALDEVNRHHWKTSRIPRSSVVLPIMRWPSGCRWPRRNWSTLQGSQITFARPMDWIGQSRKAFWKGW